MTKALKADLRHGGWQQALEGVDRVGSMITDPPFSPRTVAGHRTGSFARGGAIKYGSIDRAYVYRFVSAWIDRVDSWWVIFGDHISACWWEEALGAFGLYTFAPAVWGKTGGPPRFGGDGPRSEIEWIMIARPRKNVPKRHRVGMHRYPMVRHTDPDKVRGLVGQKPVALMRALIRDYSEPGELICDPHAGSGSTAVATLLEGRRFVGAEKSKHLVVAAQKRIDRALDETHRERGA